MYFINLGDLKKITSLDVLGFNIWMPDFDNRTALHIACSEDHRDVVEYFIHRGKMDCEKNGDLDICRFLAPKVKLFRQNRVFFLYFSCYIFSLM